MALKAGAFEKGLYVFREVEGLRQIGLGFVFGRDGLLSFFVAPLRDEVLSGRETFSPLNRFDRRQQGHACPSRRGDGNPLIFPVWEPTVEVRLKWPRAIPYPP